MSRIHVHIDRVVLNGLAPADRHAFLQNLHHELTRILTHAPAPDRSQSIPVLRLPAVPTAPGPAGAHRLATDVAHAIGTPASTKGRRP
jgi:hypothetical protein